MKAQNTSTNGLNLGAVLLVGKGAPGQLLFSHLEETVGSLACEEELLKALNAMNEEPPVKKTCGLNDVSLKLSRRKKFHEVSFLRILHL